MRLGWQIPNPVNALNETSSRFPFAAVKKNSSLRLANASSQKVASVSTDDNTTKTTKTSTKTNFSE